MIVLLTILNTLGVKMGAAVQNLFTSAEGTCTGGSSAGRRAGKRNPAAVEANFGAGWHNFWARAWHTLHAGAGGVDEREVSWPADDPCDCAGWVAVQRGCME